MRQVWIIFFASFLHIGWAIGMILDAHAASNFFVIVMVNIFSFLGLSAKLTAGTLIIAAVLGIYGLYQNGLRGLTLALPQQFLLTVTALACLEMFITGTIPGVDGSVPRGQIYLPMVAAIAAALVHSFAILDNLLYGKISARIQRAI